MRRADLIALTVAAVLGLALLASGAFAADDPPHIERAGAASGALALSNSRSGAAIFAADHLRPGDQVSGTLTLGNTGDRAGRLLLSRTGLTDSLGRGGATPLKLTLAGAATSVAFSSMVIAVVLPRADIAGGIRSWQIGGVGGAAFERIIPVLPFLAVGFAIGLLSARKLNSLALGDDLAAGLGERVATARAIGALGAILLCGATTAICGPIGFIGLVVPHLCRLLIGVDHRWLLPFSAIASLTPLTGSPCRFSSGDLNH